MPRFVKVSVLPLVALIFFPGALWSSEIILQSQKTAKIVLDPDDASWRKALPVVVPLSAQSMVSPRSGGSAGTLEVKSLYSRDEIAFLLRWKDDSKDSKWDSSGRFTDACALQFPMKSGALPSPFMGDKDNAVNIWRWMAVAQETDRFPKAYADFYRKDAIETSVKFPEKPAENLTARGFGTLERLSRQDVDALGRWQDAQWRVVLKRRMDSTAGVSFKENSVTPVSFALWNGSNKERDGMKSVAFWQTLLIGKAARAQGKSPKERGKFVFARFGCAACHGPDGKGGVKNSNSSGGEVPPLEFVKEGFTRDEVKETIRKGRNSVSEDSNAPPPPLHMNNWSQIMDEEELGDLVEYLWSLGPEKTEEW
ncbi:MAG: ethylbenzene dehydrogenase-related protein [Elusimicrobiota bacterium]